MSTKTTTNTQNQYNQSGMNAYNAFMPQLQSQLMQLSGNPLGSSFFQNQLGMAQKNASQIGQRNISNTLQNVRAGGGLLGNAGAYTNALLNKTMMGNSALQSNAFNSTLNNSLQTRNWALSAMQGFQPLQTGQNTTQQKSGLGTWLPQLAGAAIGGLSGGMGGGLMGMLSGGGGSSNPAWGGDFYGG